MCVADRTVRITVTRIKQKSGRVKAPSVQVGTVLMAYEADRDDRLRASKCIKLRCKRAETASQPSAEGVVHGGVHGKQPHLQEDCIGGQSVWFQIT